MSTKPAPRAPRACLTHIEGQPIRVNRGFTKSPFKNLRNSIQGGWLVVDYLFQEDQASLDHSWSNFFWSVRCTTCMHDTILERRQILGRHPAKCPVCTGRDKAQREVQEASRKAMQGAVDAELHKFKLATIKAMYERGMRPQQIAPLVNRSAISVRRILRQMGFTVQEDYLGPLRVDPEVQRRKRRERHTERQRERRDQRKLEGTYRPRGRPKVA